MVSGSVSKHSFCIDFYSVEQPRTDSYCPCYQYDSMIESCLFSLYRRDKLWICMEFCGGGSLQDIYHGRTKVIFYRD